MTLTRILSRGIIFNRHQFQLYDEDSQSLGLNEDDLMEAIASALAPSASSDDEYATDDDMDQQNSTISLPPEMLQELPFYLTSHFELCMGGQSGIGSF